MPNWATNKIVIEGSFENLKALKAQLSKPYKNNEETIEGDFLLWNIVKPDNLAAYNGQTEEEAFREIERNNPDLADTRSTDERLTEMQADIDSGKWLDDLNKQMATGMDWYHWNLRNWGTKWETSDDHGVLSSFTTDPDPIGNVSLTYLVTSAWSPPKEALDSLAEQYPNVSISLDSLDENELFCMSAYWVDGECSFAVDVEVTHDIYVELHGECWACATEEEEYLPERERLGCPNEEA